MNPRVGIAVVVILIAGIAASVLRDARPPAMGRHVIVHLNDFGQITRVENNSGFSLDMSGMKIRTK